MERDMIFEIDVTSLPEYGWHTDRFCMKGSPEAKNRPEEEDYGFSPEHPLYFRNFQTADRFISLLRKKRWRKTYDYSWTLGGEDPYGAVVSKVEFFSGKKKPAILFVCCYGMENATVPPKGFVLKEHWGPDSFVDDPSLVQCRYDHPKGEDLHAIVSPGKDDAGFFIGKDYAHPIVLDGDLSPELQNGWWYVSDYLTERAKGQIGHGCPLKYVYIDFICDSRYYRIYPSFIHASDSVFEGMVCEICDILRGLGYPYYRYCGMID